MTALPKRRISSGRKRRRRSQDKLNTPAYTTCIKCGETKRPHFKCPKCGYYKSAKSVKKEPVKNKKEEGNGSEAHK